MILTLQTEKELILASKSPARRKLLAKGFGIPFTVDPSGVDESLDVNDSLEEALIRLARKKARTVKGRHPGALVLGIDTMVLLGGQVLGKARDRDEARFMLESLNGKWHEVITALALNDDQVQTRVVKTRVKFRELEKWEIDHYLDSGEYRGKAGAYGIQGLAGIFVR